MPNPDLHAASRPPAIAHVRALARPKHCLDRARRVMRINTKQRSRVLQPYAEWLLPGLIPRIVTGTVLNRCLGLRCQTNPIVSTAPRQPVNRKSKYGEMKSYIAREKNGLQSSTIKSNGIGCLTAHLAHLRQNTHFLSPHLKSMEFRGGEEDGLAVLPAQAQAYPHGRVLEKHGEQAGRPLLVVRPGKH